GFAGMRGDRQVLTHREALEHAATLRYQRNAQRRNLLRRQTCNRGTEYLDLASAPGQQADGDVHARRFARAVATNETEHAPLARGKSHPLQHMAVAVEGIDALEAECTSYQDRPPVCADRRPLRSASPRPPPRRNAAA